MELKVEKCPIFNSGRIVTLSRTRSIRCYERGEERRGVFGDLRLRRLLQSEEEENWVFFVFYREGHGLAEKLLLIVLFFDKLHRHFPMR